MVQRMIEDDQPAETVAEQEKRLSVLFLAADDLEEPVAVFLELVPVGDVRP